MKRRITFFLGLLVMGIFGYSIAGVYHHIVDSDGNVNSINIGGEVKNTNSSNHVLFNDPVQEFSISIDKFNKLKIDVPANLVYENGESKIIIVAQAHVLKAIVVDQEGDEVSISSKGFSTNKAVNIFVSGNNLKELEISGAASMELQKFESDIFSLIILDSSEINMSGEAAICSLNGNDAAEVNMSDFKCDEILVDVKGSVDAIIYAHRKVKGQASDASELQVEGEPKVRDITVNDAAEVIYL